MNVSLDELTDIERTYWWHVAKRKLVSGLLRRYCPPPGLLVECGVGCGVNLLAFQAMGFRVKAFDLSAEVVDHARKLGGTEVQIQDLQEPWPIDAGAARAVVMLDVIEHVPEPVAVLRHGSMALGEGGAIVITVPAVPSLMGPYDRQLGHYRRYTAGLLRDQARTAGLRVAWLSYWNAFALAPAVAVRVLEKLLGRRDTAELFPRVTRPINSILLGLAWVERRAMSIAPLFYGLSLVAVLKRNGKGVPRGDAVIGLRRDRAGGEGPQETLALLPPSPRLSRRPQ